MKRKILSILLIIFMLSASLITIPVNAKILTDGDVSWVYDDETFTNGGVIEEDAVYETLEEYLSVHYVNYENLEKEDIITLRLADDAGGAGSYYIKDLSGLYDLTNLKQLCLWYIDNETTQAALDALDFSKLTNIEELYIEGGDIANLEIGELINLTDLYIWQSPNSTVESDYYKNLDLSKMGKIEYFEYQVIFAEELGNTGSVAQALKKLVIPPNGYELCDDFGKETTSAIRMYLKEKLDLRVSTDRMNYAVNDQVTCYVSWNKPMEMTDFMLHYDSAKLEFVSSNIEEDFYNTDFASEGEISVAWISLNELGKNEINFTFNVIGEGETEIYAVPEEFATGDLDNQFSYYWSNTQIITIDTDYIRDDAPIQMNVTNIDGEDFNLLSGLILTDNKVTVQDLANLNAFDDGITVKVHKVDGTEILSTEGLGTGSKIRLYKGQEFVRELDVIVYGDVSGDGEITSLDALTLIRAENNKLPYGYDWSTLKWSAGMVFTGHQDVHGPSAIDALAIIKHLNGKYEITQNY